MYTLENSLRKGQQQSNKEPSLSLQPVSALNDFSFFGTQRNKPYPLRKSPSKCNISHEDTLPNFVKRLKNYIDTSKYIESLDYVESLNSQIEDFSSSMGLPAKMRAAIEEILFTIQQKVNAGELCNKDTQKLLIYNFQHFACYDADIPGYSLEMMIQDKNDSSRKLTGEKISLVVLESGAIIDEEAYLNMLEAKDMIEQPGMVAMG